MKALIIDDEQIVLDSVKKILAEGIEGCTGPLTLNQRSWLEQPLSGEFLRSFGW